MVFWNGFLNSNSSIIYASALATSRIQMLHDTLYVYCTPNMVTLWIWKYWEYHQNIKCCWLRIYDEPWTISTKNSCHFIHRIYCLAFNRLCTPIFWNFPSVSFKSSNSVHCAAHHGFSTQTKWILAKYFEIILRSSA